MRVRRAAVTVLVVGVVLLGDLGVAGGRQDPEASGTSDWVTVSAGGTHTCGIRTNGRLYCVGDNTYGQVGRGTNAPNFPTIVEVAPGYRNWTAVSAGPFHTCALRRNGQLYCWGLDSDGQLGNGPAGGSNAPVLVAGGITDWAQVSAGAYFTCAVRRNGRAYCWGFDSDGQLGNGAPTGDVLVPRLVAGGITNWAQVSSGYAHACGRRRNGRIHCWGDNNAAQLGNGALGPDRPTPVPIVGGITNWASVSAGAFHTCARRRSGQVHCWGNDIEGQVGDSIGGPDNVRRPKLLAGGRTWTSVDAGAQSTCGRRKNGRLFCWGSADHGQLANGSTTADQEVPGGIAGGATDWAAPDVGWGHACARTRYGRLYCWGAGTLGQVGDGASANRSRPSEVYYP